MVVGGFDCLVGGGMVDVVGKVDVVLGLVKWDIC